MSFKGGLSTSNYSNRTLPTKGGEPFFAVRVKDIILDEAHAEYEKYGKTSAIGAIKYEPIIDGFKELDTTKLPVAFPLYSNIKTYPLLNEIVLIHSAPEKVDISGRQTNKTTYYSTIVNAWNLINHNASPSWYENKIKLGDNVKELLINPLKPSPGDIILSGRQGQSLRFTGYQHSNNPLFDRTNNGSPLTIIRNGQLVENDKQKFINEDINKDDSSIYLTSDHIVPIEPSSEKHDAFTKAPEKQKRYKGRQVLVDSGRLIFNAKDDDIILSSKENIGLTSNIVGIDAEEYIGLDANKIYLGKNARRFELQPVILGNNLEIFLSSLLTALDNLSTQLTAANANGIPILTLNAEGPALKAIVQALSKQINPNGNSQLKSRKVYTE